METLESRPPLIASRLSLLDLSTDDLRKEIIRAVRLDHSWKAEDGPLKTKDISICPDIREAKEYEVILPLPECRSHIGIVLSYRDALLEYFAEKTSLGLLYSTSERKSERVLCI